MIEQSIYEGGASLTLADGRTYDLLSVALTEEHHIQDQPEPELPAPVLHVWHGVALASATIPIGDLFGTGSSLTLTDGRTGTITIQAGTTTGPAHLIQITGHGPAPQEKHL